MPALDAQLVFYRLLQAGHIELKWRRDLHHRQWFPPGPEAAEL